jgi:GMP synthase-like glutamine amidotransferase
MTNVLAIQNTQHEGLGLLGRLLESDGFDIKSVNAKHESIPKDDFSFLLVLGAPESANDDLPYLREEQNLIQKFVKDEKPVLGICLGSQLIAKAFDANVYAGPKKEIGFYHDLYLDNTSKLFSYFENPFTVFHWHGDTFDLPKGATRLVHSNDYQNQAFQFQSAVGLQFHLEVNEAMVNLWLDNSEEKLEKISYIDSDKIRQEIEQNMSTVNENLKKFYKNFKLTFQL